MYENALRPATRFALVFLVLAIAGALFWLDLLLVEEAAAFDGAGLVVLGFNTVCLGLSVLLFARVRCARVAASVMLHVFGLGCTVAFVVGSAIDDVPWGWPTTAGVAVLLAGLSLVGILTLHGKSMREDMARPRDPQEETLRRRRARRIVGTAAALVVLSIAYASWRVVPLLLAKPTITVDYLAEARRVSQPVDYHPNLDAAPYYERMFADFVLLPDESEEQRAYDSRSVL